MLDYIDRITEPIIDFETELFPFLEDINEDNIIKLINSLEISVSNGWVGEASEISDSLLNSDIVQDNPNILINVHLERMKKYQYFELYNLAKQASIKVLELLKNNSSNIEKNRYDLWEFTAIAQLGWVEKDIFKLDEIIERGKQICIRSNESNQKIMDAFLTGLAGKLFLMNKSAEKGKEYFIKSINQLKELKYFRAIAHLKVYFAESFYEYSSKEDSYHIALEMLDENEIRKFKSHLVLRIYILLIKSNIADHEKKQKHILNLQVLMYAMGLSQSQKIYPLVKYAIELIPENQRIDFFNINFKIWLEETIKQMTWQQYELLLSKYLKDKNYTEVILLPDNFPVYDILAIDDFHGKKIATLVQAKHWNSIFRKSDAPFGSGFETAFNKIKKDYNIQSVNFIQYFVLSGITDEAADEIRYHSKISINKDVQVEFYTGNDDIVNFYLNNPSKVINLFLGNK